METALKSSNAAKDTSPGADTYPPAVHLLIVTLLIATGLFLRLDFAAPFNYVIDADEAIVGLMGKHITEGAPVPVFYYGQHYMGSFEAILAAASFHFFGINSFALKLVPLLFSLALIPIMYGIGRALGRPLVGLVASLYIAIPPAPLVVWSSKARGGFIEVIVIGALALLITVRWIRLDQTSARTGLIGLLLGLGWWINNQIIFFMVPVALFMGLTLHHLARPWPWRLMQISKHAIIGLITFFVGGLPFWLYNFSNDFVSFEMFRHAGKSNVLQHVTGFFSTALPIIIGGKRFWQSDDFFSFSAAIGLSLLALIIFPFLYHRRAQMVRPLYLGKIDVHYPLELFLYAALACFGIFMISSFGYLVQAPRYLLPAYVGLALIIGASIEFAFQRSPGYGASLLIALLGFNLGSSYWGGKCIPGEPYIYAGERVARDHTELIAWLEKKGISYVRTNYWVGYRLAFETLERVRFAVSHEPSQVRIPEYEEAGHNRSAMEVPLVLSPAQGKIIREGMRALGYEFKQATASGYEIIYDIDERHDGLIPVPSSSYTVTATSNQSTAQKAVDGELRTRWGSAAPQSPGMKFEITFKQPTLISALQYKLGEWPQDYPRGLRISAWDESGRERTILDPGNYPAIRYFLNDERTIELHTEPITAVTLVLEQTGSHPIFDWSIAELVIEK